MKIFLRWWLLFCLTGVGLLVGGMMGFFSYVADVDVTRISFIILGVLAAASIFVGRLSYLGAKRNMVFEKHLQFCWFTAEFLLGLGMIGTLVGFLILLQAAFGGQLDVSNTAATQRVLASMATGFATSGVTTLIGLSASLLLKAQLVNLEYFLNDADTVA
jgi:hypothetical protein